MNDDSARPNRLSKWSRISHVTVENFKAIMSTDIILNDVTILVGQNGSGKCSILQAIHWAARAASYIDPRNTKEMAAFDKIDYTPSSQPLELAHNGTLSSNTNSILTKVEFHHLNFDDTVGRRSTTRATINFLQLVIKAGFPLILTGMPFSLHTNKENISSRLTFQVLQVYRKKKQYLRNLCFVDKPPAEMREACCGMCF